MKKVILENKKEEVYLSDLNEDSIVGLIQPNGMKFFFINTSQDKEWIGESNFKSNSRCKYINLKQSIEKVDEVYQFDTMKELFKWLSED